MLALYRFLCGLPVTDAVGYRREMPEYNAIAYQIFVDAVWHSAHGIVGVAPPASGPPADMRVHAKLREMWSDPAWRWKREPAEQMATRIVGRR